MKKYIDKSNCRGFRIFTDNCAAIQLQRTEVLINRPTYVGFSVLEVSKLLMYEFHYQYIKTTYGKRARLLFTDTDSLMYEIQTEDLYADFFRDRHLFDFSNYKNDSPFFDNSNNKVIGKFKDEV